MSTICAVRKNGKICLAADTATAFGDMVASSDLVESHSKMFCHGDTWFGIIGSVAHSFALREAMCQSEALDFSSTDAIYRSFLDLHPILKEETFLKTDEEEDDPYESGQMEVLLVNGSGLYTVHSYRDVIAYTKFWALGSGSDFALGAMRAVYDTLECDGVARRGVEVGAEFDSATQLPLEMQVLDLD